MPWSADSRQGLVVPGNLQSIWCRGYTKRESKTSESHVSKILIIAEKPSVARDIAQSLGGFKKEGDWLESPTAIVSSGIGHLVEIHVPEAETSGTSLSTLPVIPAKFGLRAIERTKSQFNLLQRLLSRPDVDTVVNACDAGREGELIFRLIYEKAGCTKPTKRMWLQSMTTDAIAEAFRTMKPGREYDALSDAAKCRSEADWLIGINGSRGMSRLNQSLNGRYETMSAGRVQTPTLAILVHREREIANFVPDDYWEVHGTFQAEDGSYVGKWVNPKAQESKAPEPGGDKAWATAHRVNDKAQADALVKACKGVAPSSVSDQNKVSFESAPKLFDLTTLQREANKDLKFSAQKTLDIAQVLYEKHKATSYPRTDASALPEDYVAKAKSVMASLKVRPEFRPHADRVIAAGWVKPDKRIFDNSKISDHFAIIPTGSIPNSLTADEAKLYAMIVLRFIAAFHPPAEYANTTRTTVVKAETFRTTGRVLLKSGWREVYGKQSGDGKTPSLCVVKPGEQVKAKGMVLKTLSTKPPTSFTEATLLSAMEGAGKLIDDEELRGAMKGRGLGTPATRAATIEGLLKALDSKGSPKEPYVRREGKEQYLIPTPKGDGLVGFLEDNGIESLTSPRMTGEWEQKLSLMERGKCDRADFMGEIADMTRSIIDVMRAKAGQQVATPPAAMDIPHPCPGCGGALLAQGDVVDCAARCGFRLWRTVASRSLSDAEVNQLLLTGTCGVLEGFVNRARKPFSAALKLEPTGKVGFVFDDASPVGDPASATLPVPCPKCKGKLSLMKGSQIHYACEKGDFSLWRKIAGRTFTDAELCSLVSDGNLPTMEGFVSTKTKRGFKAGLKMSPDYSRADFVFEAR